MKRTQKRAVRIFQGLENLPLSERFKKLHLFSLSKRKLRVEVVQNFSAKLFSGHKMPAHQNQNFSLKVIPVLLMFLTQKQEPRAGNSGCC